MRWAASSNHLVDHWHGYVFLAKHPPVVHPPGPEERPLFFGGPFLTEQVRVQFLHVLRDVLGSGFDADGWAAAVEHFDREMGTFNLGMGRELSPEQAVIRLLTQHDDLKDLDVVALCLIAGEQRRGRGLGHGPRPVDRRLPAKDGMQRVNRFLREANVQYRFEQYRWVRTDSAYVHREMVQPALDALARDGFAGALEEFTTALDHARQGNTKEAATFATKALESTIKCISDQHGWTYPRDATAKPLFDVVSQNGLVPTWFENGLMGVVTIRNRSPRTARVLSVTRYPTTWPTWQSILLRPISSR